MQPANLNLYISITQPDGREQQVPDGDLPLTIGAGEDMDLRLVSGPPLAGIIAAEQGHLYIQPAAPGGEPLFHNNVRLTASSWLKSGDTVQCGNTMIACVMNGDRVRFFLSVAEQGPDNTQQAKISPGASSGGLDAIPVNIADYRTMSGAKKVTAAALGCLLVLLAFSVCFILLAAPVELAVTPVPDTVSLSGFPPAVKFGSSYLCLPGTYTVKAGKQGYRPLIASLPVKKEGRIRFEGKLEKLPGRLVLSIDPAENVRIYANDLLVGTTPPAEIELAAGLYSLRLEKDHFRPFLLEAEIVGPDKPTLVTARLKPDSARIAITSTPPGASVTIDGVNAGTTPLAMQLAGGRKELVIAMEDHDPVQHTIEVEAGVPQQLSFELQLKKARLTLDSIPQQAAVLIDDKYRGTTPMALSLLPDSTHEISLFLDGYQPLAGKVRLAPGEKSNRTERLIPERGVIYLLLHPPDATVTVDASPQAAGQGRLELPAKTLMLEVSAEGYKTEKREIYPKAGYAQQIQVELQPLKTGTIAAFSSPAPNTSSVTGAGQKMILVRPSTFTMGAPRREPGRRANERQRTVPMQRPYYLSEKPVTNGEYRLFRKSHGSGTWQNLSLDGKDQPAVNISWEEAAAYLNWLSEKDNLQPFYIPDGSSFAAATPPTNGYRLPTEAEWAFSARILGQQVQSRFPWGSGFPPAGKSGNFADESARGIVTRHIQGYTDGYPVTAPVGSFPPNNGGFFDMGGNISEWCHDYYLADTLTLGHRPDPLGPSSGMHRVVRGSSWRDASVKELRLSYRTYSKSPKDTIGFRIARYQ